MLEKKYSQEINEWIEALENTLLTDGLEATSDLLEVLYQEASFKGIDISNISKPSFKNTVSIYEEQAYPGNLETEEKSDIS